MRHLLPVLVLLTPLLAAGCGAAAPETSAPGVTARLRVGFPPRGLVDTIEVDAVDRLPLRSAELVAPDGAATAASYLNVADAPGVATGQSALGETWRNSITPSGTAPAVVSGNAQAGAAFRGREELLAMVSTAEIPLPDPVAYRRDWTRYRIRLSFGTPPGEIETRVVPAPAPPPS